MSFDCLTFERMNLDVSLVDLDARNKNLGTLCTKSIRDQSVLAEVSLERSVKTCLGRGSIHQSHRSEIELFRHTKQKHIRNTLKHKTPQGVLILVLTNALSQYFPFLNVSISN